MTEHIFLTGEKGVGKSTTLKKMLETSKCIKGGFITVKHNGSVHMLALDQNGNCRDLPCESNKLFNCGNNTPSKEIAQRFDLLGTEILKEALKSSELIVMDELGPAESYAEKFQEMVFQVLDSDIPVVGVLQKGESQFLDRIKEHPKVRVKELNR